ncbi:MAG: IS1595 family transposase [Legionellales bacterium]|nr:IS1595 family transposase [Legionellales bacterium]
MNTQLNFPSTLLEMQHMFPSEIAAAGYLQAVRWPNGFECRFCCSIGDPYVFENRPTILRCRKCKRDTSITVDTVMHATRTPLQVWFWAAYLVTTQTPGQSASQFQRQLGLTRYETAFQILHKLRAAMVRPNRDRIGGTWPVEVDEAYVGGKTRGEGSGVHHKAYVAGAVEVRTKVEKTSRKSIYAGRLRLQVVSSRGAKDLENFVVDSIAPKSHIITDGWVGYNGLRGLDYDHAPVVLGGDPEKTDQALPMIHIVFSNLKAWILGTHHGVSQQHLQSYLNEFVFRFNRRFYPMTAFNSVLGIATQIEAKTYDELYGR